MYFDKLYKELGLFSRTTTLCDDHMATRARQRPASPRSMGLMTNDERRHSPPRNVDIRDVREISR